MIESSITADISIEAYGRISRELRNQPKWRFDSDTDCDYYDGAQTSAALIQRLKDAGIPPQDSNLIKPTINAVLGLEARSRTDYRITSDDAQQAEIAEGLSARIKEVETESRADRAMSDAYSSMVRSGVGWVEVSREFDPLRYPYRVREIHRNEIWWDWTSKEPDLSDARYLRRDKWVDRTQAARMFPGQAELIGNSWSGWNNLDVYEGADTRMARAYEIEQAWGDGQEDYLNRSSGMVRLSELWYRHLEDSYVLALPDGKFIEYREDNPYHQAAVSRGLVPVQKSLLPRMRVAIWLGPHKLMDVPSPLPHRDFPYVPFWCFRKDRSRTPYGLIRDMRGPQDQILDLDILLYEVLNSVKVEVDNDALDLSQNTYQEVANNISSLRSMTVLNAQRRNANGFKVTREHALAAQVFQLVEERKHRIEAVSGVYRAMLGASTQATSGVAISNLVEQGSTVLAEPNDNFRYARRLVGEQLLAFIKHDMLGKQIAVTLKQSSQRKTIYFNREILTDSGPAIENDIETAQVRVVLEDIPSTPSFRAQQLQAFTQIVQTAPPAYQAVLYPAMLELSDVPNRHELADQLREIGNINPALER
ncbi:MAG: phage portal protein [Nitrosospira sp.]